jgi:hypothetical protein
MASLSICESVNVIDNNFSADSRDKDGHRVVTFDKRRAISLHFLCAHIVQIEAVADSKDAIMRGIIMMSSGMRYISERGAATICEELAKQ